VNYTNPYLSPYFLWPLGWSLWLNPQCTRCGGDHALSQCRWPVASTKGEGN
jgi:hypothetical protein